MAVKKSDKLFAYLHRGHGERAIDFLQEFSMLEIQSLMTSIDDIGRTPLHHAALLGDSIFCRFCLDHGANANAQDKAGLSPLHLAGKEDVFRILVARGADTTSKSTSGLTPEQYSVRVGRSASYLQLFKLKPAYSLSWIIAVILCAMCALLVAFISVPQAPLIRKHQNDNIQ